MKLVELYVRQGQETGLMTSQRSDNAYLSPAILLEDSELNSKGAAYDRAWTEDMVRSYIDVTSLVAQLQRRLEEDDAFLIRVLGVR